MTTATIWNGICPLDAIVSGTGVCALHQSCQVAVIRVGDRVYAIDNRDPFSGAQVLSRGLVGETDGRLYLASPLFKQRFDLETGQCLDDLSLRIGTWAVRIDDGMIELGERGEVA